jgi:hypothetical protein
VYRALPAAASAQPKQEVKPEPSARSSEPSQKRARTAIAVQPPAGARQAVAEQLAGAAPDQQAATAAGAGAGAGAGAARTPAQAHMQYNPAIGEMEAVGPG